MKNSPQLAVGRFRKSGYQAAFVEMLVSITQGIRQLEIGGN